MRAVHHLVQGSDEWKAHRATSGMFNGSEIAAILGTDPKTSRSELLRMKALGYEKEFSDYVEKKVLAKGHENEALARPLAEYLIGDDLSPLVMTDTIDGLMFSVSLDGITQGKDTTQEHKSLNMMMADALDAGVLPAQYHPQCEAGLMVSGATRCLFMASKDGDVSTMRHFWYEPNMELRARMIAACKQFAIDRDAYVHVEVAERPPAAVTIDLPALFVHAKGEITDSNMKAYGEALALRLAEVRAIALVTDQDFSNAKESAAMLRDQCAKMKLTKEAMLSQTVTIGEAARMMDAWAEDMRVTALKLEKDVEREDMAKKAAIVSGARSAYETHIKALNARLGGQYMPYSVTSPNFAEAIKGKRNYGSMTDAVDAMLANAKVSADMTADLIAANRLEMESELDWSFLFPDFASVCTKARDDFNSLLVARISKHNEAQAAKDKAAKDAEDARVAAAVEARAAAESERIAKEAAAKAQAVIDCCAAKELPIDRNGNPADPERFGVMTIDQRSDMAQSLDGLAGKSVRATPEEVRAAVVESGDIVMEYLNSLPITETERTRLRPYIMGYVQFTAGRVA